MDRLRDYYIQQIFTFVNCIPTTISTLLYVNRIVILVPKSIKNTKMQERDDHWKNSRKENWKYRTAFSFMGTHHFVFYKTYKSNVEKYLLKLFNMLKLFILEWNLLCCCFWIDFCWSRLKYESIFFQYRRNITTM